ncbi:hypothetical protein CRM22_001265 [Opisthorchis felineus]|uniref:NADH dehydrogenase [ubiquinone] 1 beta subcomplex subunit 4 n=1 Tax=Opisthorchis felineus TaxID=147828 RepID=A0A4S2MBH0_OPIFE|nr:hypothetical protein CRM22_001265 [Opisthorchis felineus]
MSSSVPFDPWKTFHESPEEQQAIKERAKYRDAMKAEYRKLYTNPFKPPVGTPHDPALQRWYSARVTHAEYIQPSPRMGLMLLGVCGLGAAIYLLLSNNRNTVLRQIEQGEISYRKRVLEIVRK